MVSRQALFMSTRRKFENGEINIISDENIIEAREEKDLKLINERINSNDKAFLIFKNKFLTPIDFAQFYLLHLNLVHFQKIGELSTMVWELAKELVT
jgi:hypothetical protein